MKVEVAGFNIDNSIIAKLDCQTATPETISAAYARISRSKKDVGKLREQAINELEKTRKSNRKIVFEMGHSSIAEHAVFNIDIVGISRYLTEFVQKSRLASFTEKSQRYVTFDEQVVVPPELDKEPELRQEFVDRAANLYRLYKEISIDIENSINPGRAAPDKLSEKAKEDARYVLPLAAKTQMGMTINARNLEGLLRRLAAVELLEARQLHKQLLEQTADIAPSLIRYTQEDSYGCCDEKSLRFDDDQRTVTNKTTVTDRETRVIPLTKNGEDDILAALFFRHYPRPYEQILNQVKNMKAAEKQKIFRSLLSGMCFYHKAPKVFELVDCLVRLSVSACCFAQLKRHRMATIITSDYSPEYHFVTPPTIKKTGSESKFSHSLQQITPLYDRLESVRSGLGNYILTNAHRRNVLFKANLRELYHFSRLRSDKHAQWEIRDHSRIIDKQLKELFPNACAVIKGKSDMCVRV